MNAVADAEELTAGWLTEVLGRTVRTVDRQRIGAGQTAAAYRLRLTGDDVPRTVVAKVAQGDEEARRRVAGGFRNEVGFYRHLASRVAVRAPRCWYAAIDDEGLRFTLLLEDLTPRTPGVQVEGCSDTRAGAAVRNLARLHAPTWNDRSLLELDWLRAPGADAGAFLGGLTTRAVEVFLDRYADLLEDDDTATLRASAEAVAIWCTTRTDPFAALHGDYRLDNLMFGAQESDVVAVDWQTMTVGPPARDVAYFLGTSLEIGARRRSEQALVALYHAELVALGVQDYSFARCVEDYRLGQLQGPMITMIGAAHATAARSTSADDMFLAMARRSCAAVRDLDTLALLATRGDVATVPHQDGSESRDTRGS